MNAEGADAEPPASEAPEPSTGSTSPEDGPEDGWGASSRRGASAALAISLLGVATAAFDAAVVPGTTTMSAGEIIRLGGVYLASFHRVPLKVGVPLGGAPVTIGLTVAPLLGTMFAVWLLYRAGRSTATATPDASPIERLSRGLRVVPAYAIPVAMIFLALAIAPLQLGPISVGPVVAAALVFPFVWSVFAVGAGALIGGRRRGDRGSPVGDAVAAGWRMLVAGLVLAFACSVLVVLVRPDDARIFFPGIRALDLEAGPLLAGHNLLFLPNEAEVLLAVSTGACVEVDGTGVQQTIACRGALDIQIPAIAPGVLVDPSLPSGGADDPTPTIYFIFLLAPALATLWGGWVVGKGTGSGERRAAVVRGLGAGVSFALLSGGLAWLASASIDLGGLLSDQPAGAGITVGVHPVGAAAFALGWGVVGGAIGAAGGFSRRVDPVAHPSS